MPGSGTQVVWFKRDLRLYDHLPLHEAASHGAVLPLFIIEPDYWRLDDVSNRHWRFLRDSLRDLDQQLGAVGARLILRHGDAVEVLELLRRRWPTLALWSHEESGNGWTYRRDLAVADWARAHGVTWTEIPSHGVVRRLASRDGWQKLRDERMSAAPLPAPAHLTMPADVGSDPLPAADALPIGGALPYQVQPGGRGQALPLLRGFLDRRSRNYLATLSKPGLSARHCSRLSPHIAYGTLSVREIDQAARAQLQNLPDDGSRRNLRAFLSRLAWRCHFVQKLEQQPAIEYVCMHPAFEGMREADFRPELLQAWVEGRTGYPLIDAAMRSLIANGWITFRMRAMLVSFASYHLWLDWRVTAPVLARLFTDYEPGIHYSQLQMQSGVTGINAVRIYNPVKQSIDHDPDGRFIRRYLPELADIGNDFLHQPWRLANPPKHYPAPVVEHETAIREARQKMARIWRSDGFREVAREVNVKLGSRNRTIQRRRASRRDQPDRQLRFDL